MRRHFLRVFIPMLLVALTVTSLVYRAHYSGVKKEIRSKSEVSTDNFASQLGTRCLSIGRGLYRITQLYFEDENVEKAQLQRDLFGFINSRNEVIQIRLIDTHGRERIRYNRQGDSVYLVSDMLLQNKENRDYFKDHLNDPKGSIGYTSIELNREFGEIELPYQLVSRWIVPLFNSQGERLGMLVCNIDINMIIAQNEKLLNRENQFFIVKTFEEIVHFRNKIYAPTSSDSLLVAIGLKASSNSDTAIPYAGLVVSDTYNGFPEIIDRQLRQGDPVLVPNMEDDVHVFSFIPSESYLETVHNELPYILSIQSFLVLLVGFIAYRWARFRMTEEFNYRELISSNRALKVSQDELNAAKIKLEERVEDQYIQLSESQQLLSTLFDSSVHYAGVIDTKGTLINVNRMTLETLGVSKQLVLGKKIWEFDVFGDPKQVQKSMHEAIAHAVEGNKVAFDSTMKDKDGVIRRIAFSLAPIVAEDGSVKHLVPEGVDITELYEKDKQLNTVLDQMSTRNKQLKEFSHIISHNVRSPIGNLGLLLSILDDAENNEERNEIISKLKDVNTSLQSLLEELLETVKILDNAEIRIENTELVPAIEQARNLLSRQIEESGAEISIELKSEQVHFPKLYLNSLFLNLMSNAIKYRSEERPLLINIVSATDSNGFVIVSFSDNGSGIDLKKNGHKVFGLYKTFDRNRPGKGLGLFMTKTQIESCGGKIQIRSKLGEGTEFTVTFPSPV